MGFPHVSQVTRALLVLGKPGIVGECCLPYSEAQEADRIREIFRGRRAAVERRGPGEAVSEGHRGRPLGARWNHLPPSSSVENLIHQRPAKRGAVRWEFSFFQDKNSLFLKRWLDRLLMIKLFLKMCVYIFVELEIFFIFVM